jgi:hypothetical protein
MVLLLCSWSFACAQKSTEIYIPIGKCPGLSGKYTVIGKIEAVDPQKKTLTLADSTGRYIVKITDRTLIWLDLTRIKAANKVAALPDCRKGRLVEVKFLNNDRKEGIAEWIKVGEGSG